MSSRPTETDVMLGTGQANWSFTVAKAREQIIAKIPRYRDRHCFPGAKLIALLSRRVMECPEKPDENQAGT